MNPSHLPSEPTNRPVLPRVLALVSTLLAACALLVGGIATPVVATAVGSGPESAETVEAEAEEAAGRRRGARATRRGIVPRVLATRPRVARRSLGRRPVAPPRLVARRGRSRRGPPPPDD